MNNIKKLLLIGVVGFIVGNSNLYAMETKEQPSHESTIAVYDRLMKKGGPEAIVAHFKRNQHALNEVFNYAVTQNHADIVEMLLESKDVSLKHHPHILHLATEYSADQCLPYLLEYGASVNRKDESGKTPIFYAAEKIALYPGDHEEDIDNIKSLLRAGAESDLGGGAENAAEQEIINKYKD